MNEQGCYCTTLRPGESLLLTDVETGEVIEIVGEKSSARSLARVSVRAGERFRISRVDDTQQSPIKSTP